MELVGLLTLIDQDPRLRRVLELVQGREAGAQFPATSLEVLEAARPYLVATLQRHWPGPVIIVSGRPEQARAISDNVRAWSPDSEQVLYYHAPDNLFYDRAPWDRETIQARLNVLAQLTALGNRPATSAPEDDVAPGKAW